MSIPKLALCTLFACVFFAEIFSQTNSSGVNGNSLSQKIYAGARNAPIGNVAFNDLAIPVGAIESHSITSPICESCVSDTPIAPTIGFPGPNATILCTATPTFNAPTVSGGCGGATLEQLGSDVTVGSACSYTVTRTWDAVDTCGNHSATVSQSISIVDITPPTIGAAGANLTIACTATPAFTPPTAADQCSGATINLLSNVTVAGTCASNRTVTRTWDAVDACGNHSATVSQRITITDITPPTIGAAGANATIACTATPIFTPPTTSDLCSGATINLLSNVTVAGTCASNRTVTRTWDAVDACGNHSATVSQTITIRDITPPTISLVVPAINIECGGTPFFIAPTASDACGGATVNQLFDVTVPGTCPNKYTVIRTWDAVDACSNHSATVSQTMTVMDTTPPAIGAAGANATIQSPATPSFTAPTASDLCGSVTVRQLSDVTASGISCSNCYTETRTWDAVDACGNHSATVSQKITVVDSTSSATPTIGAPGTNATIACPGTPTFTAPTVSGGCGGVTLNNLPDVTVAGTCVNNYAITRTWQAVDTCGNHSATVSQTITVMDITPPLISPPVPNITIECGGTPFFIAPTASDVCGGATVNQLFDVRMPGTCINNYTEIRTWDAVDACGNHSATVSQTITVIDSTPPTIGAAGANATIVSPATPSFTAPTASDLCGPAAVHLLSDVTAAGNCTNCYTEARAWDAVDSCGNHSATVTQTITVLGVTPPDTTCGNGNSLFQNIYSSARNDFAYNLTPAADGGYVIVGVTNSFGNGGTDGLITKIGKNGSVVWNKAVGGTGDDILYMVRKTSDGGFIACGQTKSFGNAAGDAWLVKLDASGMIQWSKRYGDGNVYGDIAFDVTQLSDGGYAFAGTHRFAGGVADGLVVRTDLQGNVVWSKSYGNWNSDDANGIMEDGNFLIVTGLYYAATFYDSYVMKLDKSTGALQWIRGYDAENRSTWMTKIAKINTGYQVLSVVTDNFVDQNQQQCIWNINTDGSLQNVRKLSIPGNWTSSYGWYPLADGGFIGSNGENNNSESDALVFRVNANGSLQFSKQFPMTGKQALWSATSAPDGGYVLAGYSTNAATIADSNNIYVVKIDSLGGSCSGINTNAVTVVNPSFTLPTPDIVALGDVTISNSVITVGVRDFLPITNTICETCHSAELTITATGINLALGCNAYDSLIDAALGSAIATGGCGTPIVTVSTGIVERSGCSRSQTRTFSATDTCGNTAITSRTATWIEDRTPPTIIATGGNLNLGCNPSSNAIDVALGTASATDSCSTPFMSTFTGLVQTNGCARSQTRTFFATDSCGNSALAQRTATWIVDVTPPTITTTGGSFPLGCNPSAAAIETALGSASAIDACQTPTLTISTGAVQINGCARSQTRTFTATDSCGNTATASRTATWTEQNTGPTMTIISGPTTLGCNPSAAAINAALGSASATDFCSTPTLTTSTGPVQSSGCLRSQTRTFIASNSCGQSNTGTITVTWTEDHTAPTIATTGSPLELGCNPSLAAIDAALGSATATDSCSTPTLTTSTGSVQSSGCSRSQTRTFIATDTCGNTATRSRTATWTEDHTAPTIACGQNTTVECDAPIVFDQPTATDSCDNSPTISVVSTSADGLTRTWRATDACGNSATCSQTITVAACGAHLFPTATTCCNYVTGTAPQLQKVCYTKSGNSISKVVPGVFFYYSFVTAPSSGPFVITVEQLNNNASFQLFAVQNVTQIRLTDMSCGTTSLVFTPSTNGTNNSQAVLTVSSYTPGATYVVSVKYDAKSIIGSTFGGTPTATYTFKSKVNGVIASGSTGTLNAQFGCQDNTPNPPNNCQLTTMAQPTTEPSESEPGIRAYPNPFTDIVNFQISTTVSGKVTLEVYNLQGQKLGIAFEGWMTAGEVRSVQYKSRSAGGGLIYQLTTGDKKMSGKIFRLK